MTATETLEWDGNEYHEGRWTAYASPHNWVISVNDMGKFHVISANGNPLYLWDRLTDAKRYCQKKQSALRESEATRKS